MRVGLFIPTLNGATTLDRFADALERQTVKPDRMLVIDSSSTDATPQILRKMGAEVITIPKSTFDHGRTRTQALEILAVDCDIVILMTQDAVLAEPGAIATLLSNFDTPNVLAAFGRQLPRPGAGPIESFARLHNYPDISRRLSRESVPGMGFRASFFSNSFAAYRIKPMLEVGGFSVHSVVGEDAIAAIQLLIAGGVISYDAKATVYHSHGYTLGKEFSRYFDIGAMHSRNRGMLLGFGSPRRQGRRFVFAEFLYLLRWRPLLIPEALLRNALKLTAYLVGRMERHLSLDLQKRLSSYPDALERLAREAEAK